MQRICFEQLDFSKRGLLVSLNYYFSRYFFTSSIAQRLPHMEHAFSFSIGSRLSLYFFAFFGSIQSSNILFQSRFSRAALNSESTSLSIPRARSAACAAIRAAITPSQTSSLLGKERCSAGVM